MTPPDPPFSYRRTDGITLRGAFRPATGRAKDGALVAFLSGFRSVHTGEKATAVAAFAKKEGHACLRFDYLGHGASEGTFDRFRISEAMLDAAGCIEQVREEGQRLFIAGSSMGGWIGLELVRRGIVEADGLLLIAPAVDFVSRRLATLPVPMLEALKENGFVDVPDDYAPGEHYRLDQAFFIDAMMAQPPPVPMTLPCPVRIVHGTEDEAVPVAVSRDLARRIDNAVLREIEGGDHRLGGYIPILLRELEGLVGGTD